MIKPFDLKEPAIARIKDALQTIERYDSIIFNGGYFLQVREEINQAIAGESLTQMKQRAKAKLGRIVGIEEIFAVYFEDQTLLKYAAFCKAVAGFVSIKKAHPLEAIALAKQLALFANYQPKIVSLNAKVLANTR
jgi:hypothetical protein